MIDKSMSLPLGQIAAALSLDYECVFFVDIDSDDYSMYAFRGKHKDLDIYNSGDFWGDTRKNLQVLIFEEDKPSFASAFNKQTLLDATATGNPFAMKYRLVIDSKPVWFSLKAVADTASGRRFWVIGISNIDEQERAEQELRRQADKGVTYSRIVMALAEHYTSLYLVNLETEHFAQYKANHQYRELRMAMEGDNFFAQLQEDAKRVIYQEDLALVSAALRRDVLLKEIDENGVFSFTYRLMMSSRPVYVNLNAVYADANHIILSVTNVDARVRREIEIKRALGEALAKSRHDDLTGIRNKNAFGEFEEGLDRQIKSGEVHQFAIAICDVNGLKTVNDTQGHKAGDAYIQAASRLVCETFKHSPVFRIGGDEFVAILRGSDYECRDELERSLDETSVQNYANGKVSIACGICEFREGDTCSGDVFKRADKLMYEKKNWMKKV